MTAAMSHPVGDPFPYLHVRPPTGWLNDPNGLGHWGGRWHVFFQHNPDSARWGSICWGHASSPDLLRWEYHEPVLRPRPGDIDAAGSWSGVCVIHDGEPVLVYTAVPTSAHDAGVALAFPDGAGGWVGEDHHVVPPNDDPGVADVRDPFLLTVDGHRYAVQGAGRADRSAPLVLAWAVDELDRWRPLGVLAGGDDDATVALAPAQVWECPQLVRLPHSPGGRGLDRPTTAAPDGPTPDDEPWVLIVSRWSNGSTVGATAVVGRLDGRHRTPRFVGRTSSPMDHGPDFYAPQAYVDRQLGRVLVWGWTWEGAGRTSEQVDAAGWAGALTFPRELVLVGDEVRSEPARELVGLRGDALIAGPEGLVATTAAWEVVGSGPAAVRLDRDGSRDGRVVWQAPEDAAEVRVLVDGSVLEAFADGQAWTVRVYPEAGQVWHVEGGRGVTGWELDVPPEDTIPGTATH